MFLGVSGGVFTNYTELSGQTGKKSVSKGKKVKSKIDFGMVFIYNRKKLAHFSSRAYQ